MDWNLQRAPDLVTSSLLDVTPHFPQSGFKAFLNYETMLLFVVVRPLVLLLFRFFSSRRSGSFPARPELIAATCSISSICGSFSHLKLSPCCQPFSAASQLFLPVGSAGLFPAACQGLRLFSLRTARSPRTFPLWFAPRQQVPLWSCCHGHLLFQPWEFCQWVCFAIVTHSNTFTANNAFKYLLLSMEMKLGMKVQGGLRRRTLKMIGWIN